MVEIENFADLQKFLAAKVDDMQRVQNVLIQLYALNEVRAKNDGLPVKETLFYTLADRLLDISVARYSCSASAVEWENGSLTLFLIYNYRAARLCLSEEKLKRICLVHQTSGEVKCE